jgi:uncharacterized protein
MWEIVSEIGFFLIIFVLLFGGLILSFVNLPGAWIIWIGILLTAIVKGFENIPLWFVILTFFLALVVGIIDNFIIPLAAKKYGGGKWGMLGGVLGAFFGFIFFNLPGLLMGPFLGAFAFEYYIAKKERGDAIRAGTGSFIGVILTIALKVFICFGMIIAFLIIWIF